jgi:hypothetical protein
MNEIIDELLIELSKINVLFNNYHRPNASGIRRIVQHGQDKLLNRKHVYGYKCESITFGKKKRMFVKGLPYQESIFNKKYENIYQLLLELAPHVIPQDFPDIDKDFNICLNRNFQCLAHYDANDSDSIIVSFGNYTQGRLILHHDDDDLEYIDINRKPFQFNGKKIKHSTEPFEGNRISVVYYVD